MHYHHSKFYLKTHHKDESKSEPRHLNRQHGTSREVI
ncbi:unnamed protein product [Arabidopsis halleri]